MTCDICHKEMDQGFLSNPEAIEFKKKLNLHICFTCRIILYRHELTKNKHKWGSEPACQNIRKNPEILFFINFSQN